MKDSVHQQGAPPLLKSLLALILPITLQSLIHIHVRSTGHPDQLLLQDYIRCTAPMQFNYIIWCCAWMS